MSKAGKEPAEKVADSTCFSDEHLLMRGRLYWLCLEATKPLQLNRLEEGDSGEISHFSIFSSMVCNNRRGKGWWTLRRFFRSFPESWAITTAAKFWLKCWYCCHITNKEEGAMPLQGHRTWLVISFREQNTYHSFPLSGQVAWEKMRELYKWD